MEKIIELPKIYDIRGNLSFIEGLKHIPFKIERAYWIYDVPGGEERGSHAFRSQHEFIVALSGSFDVVLNDGETIRRHHLNRSYKGVYVPPMNWRSLDNFSTNSLCLVLSSQKYDEGDYIEDFAEFLKESDSYIPDELYDSELCHGNKENEELDSIFSDHFHDSTIDECNIYKLPQVHNPAGNLTSLNNNDDIPFEIKRAYYLYDVPTGAERGGHAHKNLFQFIVAASGSFDVIIDDGNDRKTVTLNRPDKEIGRAHV